MRFPVWVLPALLACSGGVAREDAGVPDGGPVDAGPPPHRASAQLQACASLAGPVQTIAQLVTRLNALPRPTTVPCLVAALPRPLSVVATRSRVSAQPAGGAASPRIFILNSGLVLSVVPSGDGAKLIEMGEWQSSTRTLKGELEMPVTGPLDAGAPFERVAQPNQTSVCSLCHRGEAPHPTLPNAYVSTAFRPEPGLDVTVSALASLHQQCVDTAEDSERCTLLHALHDFGAVNQGAFAREVELFIP